MQAPRLSEYIKVYDDALHPFICQNLIALFDNTAHSRTETDTYQFDVINLNQIPDLAHVGIDLAKTAAHYAERYFRELKLPVLPTVQGFEEVRLKRYRPGDQFKPHVDVGDYASARRYLYALFYLNTLNHGDTEFPGLGVKIKPRQGRLVLFPPFWLFPHAGRPALSENKYTVATALHYL